MRSRTFLFVGLTLAILLGGSGAIYAYDSSRGDTIAPGIRVAGIDVGGLSPAAARSKLEAQYVAALQKPIRVHHDKSTWTLGPREAKIATDLEAVLADAQARSDTGNVLSRSFRRLTGGTVEADLTPQVTFSDKAVIRTIDKVRRGVNRKPVEAKLDISLAGFKRVKSRVGLSIDASGLHKAINAAIVSPTADRRFVATTAKKKPKVTTGMLAKQNGTVLIVDKSRFEVRLYKDLKLAKTYKVAIGAPAYPTPEGTFTIQNKQVDPVWSVPNSPWAGELAGSAVAGGTAANPLKARWMGVTDGVGFHGTSDDGSIGSAASHGCMRMHVSDIIDLFPRVPVGAKVLISS